GPTSTSRITGSRPLAASWTKLRRRACSMWVVTRSQVPTFQNPLQPQRPAVLPNVRKHPRPAPRATRLQRKAPRKKLLLRKKEYCEEAFAITRRYPHSTIRVYCG